MVAAKLAAIRNYEFPEIQRQIEECPRMVEMLWFLQAMSLRPGGLAKFAEEILAAFHERLGTPTMLKAAGRECSLEEKFAIWCEVPSGIRPDVHHGQQRGITELLSAWSPEEVAAMETERRVRFDAALRGFDVGLFREQCRRAALRILPFYLFTLCTQKDQGLGGKWLGGRSQPHNNALIIEDLANFLDGAQPQAPGSEWARDGVWFFGDVIGAVMEMMERHASQAQKRLAMTQVAQRVFDTLDYAIAEKVMVRIEGASRFGKTEALQAWCDMRPGLARLVRVPCDTSMSSFLKRVAEALGIDCSYGSNVCRLKDRIEYVIKHGGLFLVLDEGAFLIPQDYTETTAPQRLNWVRTEIVDRNLPLAIAVTPQSFESAVSRFIKKTHYTMEQFIGRNFLTCRLPAALAEEDLIAVARIHFPEMDENVLGYIASEARLSQNYLQAVEAIAKLARWKAAKASRAVGLKDLKGAVAEVLSRETPAAGGRDADDTGNGAGGRSRVSGLNNAPLKAALRPVKPAGASAAGAVDLPGGSLRGAGPGRAKADFISADS
jgi:hypothetical protein